jgi:hypothetical protein
MGKSTEYVVTDIDRALALLKTTEECGNNIEATYSKFLGSAAECDGHVGNNLSQVIGVFNELKPEIGKLNESIGDLKEMLESQLKTLDEMQNMDVSRNLEIQ